MRESLAKTISDNDRYARRDAARARRYLFKTLNEERFLYRSLYRSLAVTYQSTSSVYYEMARLLRSLP